VQVSVLVVAAAVGSYAAAAALAVVVVRVLSWAPQQGQQLVRGEGVVVGREPG
jgi:hypothetical protein